eukprot:gene8740-10342_t
MSELTKEQLLEYVKKQKLKMKKLETEIASLKEMAEAPVAAAVSGGSEEEISTLRLEIETLEKQLNRRDEEITSLSKSIEEAEDEKIQLVAKKNAEIAALQHANELLQSDGSDKSDLLEKVGKLEATITAQRAEIEAYVQSSKETEFMKAQLDSALAREATAQAEIVDLNDRMEHIKVSTSHLSESNSSYTNQISEFQALITDLQDRLSAFETCEAALRSELQAREASTIAINEQLSASLEIIVGLKNTIESQKVAQAETTATLATAQTELDVVKADAQSASTELTSTKEALQSAQTELQRVQSDLLRATTELLEKVTSLTEATKRITDLEGELETLSKGVPADPPAPSDSGSTASPLVAADVSTSNGSKKKGKNNKKGKGKGGADNADSSADAELVAEPASVEVATTETVNEVSNSAVVQQLEASLSEALQQRAALEQTHAAQLATLEEQLAPLLAVEQKAREESAALTARLEALSAEWTEGQAKMGAISTRSAELETEKSRLEAQLQKVTEELALASSGANASTQSLHAELASLKSHNEQLENQLRTSLSAAEAESQSLRDAASVLQAQCDQLTEQLRVASSGAEASVQALHDEILALKTANEQLTSNLEATTSKATLADSNLEQANAELASQREALAELQAQASTLQAENQVALESRATVEGILAQKETELETLRAEICALKDAGDSTLSELSAGNATLLQQITDLQNQLQAVQAADAAKNEELVTLKETSVVSETNNKKLLAKLKLKMKECTDLTAELASVKDAASKSASAEVATASLSDRIQQLEGQVKSVSAEKTDLEAKLKSTNDTLIAGEERISALLREKNKLQEDLFETLHKVESAAKESHGFKTERDLARQQYLDTESKLQALSNNTREKMDLLTTRVTELSTLTTTQASQITTLNESLALSNSEITTLKGSAAGASQAKDKLKAMTASVESLKQQLQESKTDADAKAEAGAERIKKLKQLLAKVNAALQEKDSRLNQLQSANDRAKKFNIVSRIGIVPPQNPSGEELQWCLIYEHRATSSAKTGASASAVDDEGAPQYRWIEARVAHKWMAEGSTLVGAWPQPVQETWAAELSTVRTRLEAERDELSVKFEEVSSQFQAYKVRAQTALKRIGNEDRNERQKVQEAENAEIEKLRGVVQDLREREGDFNATFAEKDRLISHNEVQMASLRGEIEALQNSLADGAEALQSSERRIATLQKEIETLHEDNTTMKEQYEAADRNNRERRMQQLRQEEEAALRAATTSSATKPSINEVSSLAIAPVASEVQDRANEDLRSDRAASPLLVESAPASQQRGISRDASFSTQNSVVSPRGRPLAVEAALFTDATDASDNKLLLFQQADNMLRDSIAILRQENSQLMVEINELKNDFGLREDQVQALKATVRELESSLCREKEFNAENRRINADYLVNILRNFLMSTEPSERAKLVPVLCQILHLGAEESRIIAEKWAVRTGGLVGWLLPPRPAATGPAVSPRYQQHATGMSIDRGDTGSKPSGGDISYDPTTGAGIDVNFY